MKTGSSRAQNGTFRCATELSSRQNAFRQVLHLSTIQKCPDERSYSTSPPTGPKHRAMTKQRGTRQAALEPTPIQHDTKIKHTTPSTGRLNSRKQLPLTSDSCHCHHHEVTTANCHHQEAATTAARKSLSSRLANKKQSKRQRKLDQKLLYTKYGK